MKNDFNLHYEDFPDTIVLSYDESKVKELPQEMAADLLSLLIDKFSDENKFFEFNPPKYAGELLSPKKRQEFASQHSQNFILFKISVIEAIKYSASKSPSEFVQILENLYKYESVIDSVPARGDRTSCRSSNFEVSYQSMDFLKEFSPSMAIDVPGYINRFLDRQYAIRHNKPQERLYKNALETNHYLFDNYPEANPLSQPYNILTEYVKNGASSISYSVEALVQNLKVVDAINQQIILENSQKSKPKI